MLHVTNGDSVIYLHELNRRHTNTIVPLGSTVTVDALGGHDRDRAIARRSHAIELNIITVIIRTKDIRRSDEGFIEDVGFRDEVCSGA